MAPNRPHEKADQDPPADHSATGSDANVPDLLSAYSEARGLAREPPPSVTLPTHGRLARLLRAIYLRLRPTWFVERWTARELRRRVGALERGAAQRLALGEPTDREIRDHETLQRFKESLPSPASGLVTAFAVVAAILLTQAVTNGLIGYLYLDQRGETELTRALGDVGLTPDPGALGAVLRQIGGADLELLFAFVVGLAVSGYVLGRGPVSGYRLARLVLGQRDGLGVPRRGAELTGAVAATRIRQLEPATFAALDCRRPGEFPFDLATKALLAVGVLFLGFYGLRTDLVDPDDRWEFGIFAAVASVRLLWLAGASMVRGSGLAWLAIPLALVIAGGTLVPTYHKHGPINQKNRALATSLSLRGDLAGADLQSRDLSHFYLRGKDLSHANLSNATLRGASLAKARLLNAKLYGANLRYAWLFKANLRGAQLSGAKLDSAVLCGADLRGARLDHVHGRPYSDKHTRWPENVVPPHYTC